MFSMRQKREIAEKVQQILRDTAHPELPTADKEINFKLFVEGAESYSWADIRNNGAVTDPDINPHNEAMDAAMDTKDNAPTAHDKDCGCYFCTPMV